MSEQNQSDPAGEVADTNVVVSRVVSGSLKETWRRIVTVEGAEVILGEGGVLGDKGDSWRARDGSHGMIRTFHPLEQLRFTWHETEGAPGMMVDIKVRAAGAEETEVDLQIQRVPAGADTEAIRSRWRGVLSRL